MDNRPQLPQVQTAINSSKAVDGANSGDLPLDQSSTSHSHSQSGGSTSEDAGVSELDRQYIEKAISVVENNSDDPYAQSKAISQIRAEYISEKFGKQINSST